MGMVKVTAADGHELGAYVAEADAPVGAVVLVQEIFGVNKSIRGVADRLAAAGYTAIAPALFDRYERDLELTYEGEDMQKAFELYGKLSPETALLDIAAAFKEVENKLEAVAVMGFCYGGLMSWLSATRAAKYGMDPACAVGFYAGGIGSVATEEPVCPVMLHFGLDDSHIGAEQRDAVKAAHPEVKVYEYEGAGHGFFNVDRKEHAPEAAKLAWERTLEFLKSNLA